MRKFFGTTALSLVAASVLLTGCKSSGDNANPEPIIHTPGRVDITVQVSAPAGYYPVQTLEQNMAWSMITMFVGFGYDFTDPEDLLQFFTLPTGGSFTKNVQKGGLLMVEAFNPLEERLMASVIGYQDADNGSDLGSYAIGPVTDAVADAIFAMGPDPEQGLSDEYKGLVIGSIFDEAAKGQLIVEGSTPEDAEAATDPDLQAALDRLLADATAGEANMQTFLEKNLDGSVWSLTGSDMSLTFSGSEVVYNDGGGNVYDGSFELARNSGVTTLEVNVPSVSTDSVVFDGVIAGGNEITLFSNTLTRQ